MIRGLLAVLSGLMAIALVSACDPLGRPELNPAFGARVTDGALHIWTGSLCHRVIELGLTFDPSQDDRVEWMMKAPNSVGVDVERFTLGEPVPGLEVTQPLPANFDWRAAESVRITVTGGGETGGWGTTTKLADVINDSAQHPDDTYFFQGVGWLNPADVAAKDGKDFLATCTVKPA
jgi:hypothetical protein